MIIRKWAGKERGFNNRFRDNINVNDVLGDYSLGLIDTLDSLVVFGKFVNFFQKLLLIVKIKKWSIVSGNLV